MGSQDFSPAFRHHSGKKVETADPLFTHDRTGAKFNVVDLAWHPEQNPFQVIPAEAGIQSFQNFEDPRLGGMKGQDNTQSVKSTALVANVPFPSWRAAAIILYENPVSCQALKTAPTITFPLKQAHEVQNDPGFPSMRSWKMLRGELNTHIQVKISR